MERQRQQQRQRQRGSESRFEDGTPSTASRVKAVSVENAFPTPPRHKQRRSNTAQTIGTTSPGPHPMFTQRAASTPPEHPSKVLEWYQAKANSGGLPNSTTLEVAWRQSQLAKKTNQYFDGAFGLRESSTNAKDRVMRDSVIVAEAKLGCCLESEQDFLIDFSFQLSELFQRPISSVMVVVSTDSHILMGGSPDPAYYVTVTALSTDIAATKNKRSTHILQRFFSDVLNIPPSRGVVKFEFVIEENLATNGVTIRQEIERLERLETLERQYSRSLSRQTNRLHQFVEPESDANHLEPGTFPYETSIHCVSPNREREQEHHETPSSFFGITNMNTSIKSKIGKRRSILGFKLFKFGRSELAA